MQPRIQPGLLILSLAFSSQVFASSLSLPSPGFYVGPGQNVTDVLRVLPKGNRVVLGALPILDKNQLSSAAIRETASLRYRAYPGQLEIRNGRIWLVLQPLRKKDQKKPCRYRFRLAKGGWNLGAGSPACANFHGFQWSFREFGNEVLVPDNG